MKILICDDDKFIRSEITRILEDCRTHYPNLIIDECGKGNDVLEKEFDLLILDIEMSDISGIALKDALESRRSSYKILFCTNHSELMPEAFGKNVYGFIQKPINKEQLLKSVRQILEKIENEKLPT